MDCEREAWAGTTELRHREGPGADRLAIDHAIHDLPAVPLPGTAAQVSGLVDRRGSGCGFGLLAGAVDNSYLCHDMVRGE